VRCNEIQGAQGVENAEATDLTLGIFLLMGVVGLGALSSVKAFQVLPLVMKDSDFPLGGQYRSRYWSLFCLFVRCCWLT